MLQLELRVMRTFKVMNLKESEKLHNQFPQLKNKDCDLEDFPFNARVCIFDHFLNYNEAIELIDNVSKVERIQRDLRWSKLYQLIIQEFDVYMVKYRGGKVIFKAPRSPELLQQRLDNMDDAGHVDFVIPALGIWYQQYYDDTHLVCYSDEQNLVPFLKVVNLSGLFWLK
ncbi:hypothetical protein ACROAE_14985 [Shewanella sp. MF05960]|uniref:hypothetical protein n=1 Tax=Shewanella sp. MF05960 TaxID=3434874 RepID=UPI003D7929E5